MTALVLPDLPYDYADLEPHISARLMRLHHDKHHAAYVDGANKALEGLSQARAHHDYAAIGKLARDLAFNLAGHVNHTLFWHNLSPAGADGPSGELAPALERAFGSVEAFKEQFNATALAIQGSGWVMLACAPIGGLQVFQLHDHQDGMTPAATPLLLLDMWEHAFYLDYQTSKADYVAAFWNVVDWDEVSRRYTMR